MSQQINLLQERGEPVASGLWALALIAMSLAGMGAYAFNSRSAMAEQQRAADAGAAQVAQIQQGILARQAAQKSLATQGQAAELQKEIEALGPRADLGKRLSEELRAGAQGNPAGYSEYLISLARVPEEDLWINSVTITQSGKSLVVSGQALRIESVLSYAKRLNRQFAPYGVQFNSIEMNPQAATGTNVATVSFKLS